MKIIMWQDGNDTKVLLDDGTDITRELGVTEINVSCRAGGYTEVSMTVTPSEIEVVPAWVKFEIDAKIKEYVVTRLKQ